MRFIRSLSKLLLVATIFTSATPAHAYQWQHFKDSLQDSVIEQLSQPQQSVPPVRRVRNIQRRQSIRTQERTMTPTAVDNMPTSPNRHVTRGEFVSAIVHSMYGSDLPRDCYLRLSPSQYWLYFSDVAVDAPYAPELCAAIIGGLVDGYDNATFRANQPINLAEASTIVGRAYRISHDSSDPSVVWYGPHVEALRARGGIPANADLATFVTPQIMGTLLRSAR